MATPKIIPYEVQLRSTKIKRNISRPVVYTNDLNSAEFQFHVTDMEPGELSTATATTLIKAKDGSFFQGKKEDVGLVGTTFTYTLKENEGNHAGIATIQLIVYFDAGSPNEQNFPSQIYEFEIVNGLDSKVAQEIMIHDWTTLTREARAYIDQFVADEMLRDAEFDNNEFDRNTAFVASQDARTLAFGTEQTNRGTAFTNEQNERTTAFNESESGRTTAETGRVTAESNRVTAESGRVTKESQRVTAESNRVTAEGNRVTAETGRVTAENARVTAETNRAAAFTAFNTRLTAEEIATAANKISAVKGKTFADVDSRIEDVEFDTTLMATNLVANGDFSNGTTGFTPINATASVISGLLRLLKTGSYTGVHTTNSFGTSLQGHKVYTALQAKSDSAYNFRLSFTENGLSAGVQFAYATLAAETTLKRFSNVLDVPINAAISTMYLRIQDPTNGFAGTYLDVDNLIVLDLTAAFGKGNEPTVEQMDGIMAKFTNSWFDGTKNLFRANATLNKLMAVDARTEFDAKNDVTNGDFSNGMSSWNFGTNVVTKDVTNGKLSFVGAGVGSTVPENWVRNPNNALKVGDKYYRKVSARVSNSNGGTDYLYVLNDYWEQRTCLLTATTTLYSDIVMVANRSFPNLSASVGTTVEVDDVIWVNLTTAFGAGKEPTLAEMDRLMARFPNSWFDGVKPIQTIETLYQEKANKVQESWITPTLLNGWTGSVKYAKNDLNMVTLKFSVTAGTVTIATPICTLPTGYRPQHLVGIRGNNASTGPNCDLRINSNGNLEIIGGVSAGNNINGEIVFSIA